MILQCLFHLHLDEIYSESLLDCALMEYDSAFRVQQRTPRLGWKSGEQSHRLG